jgi:hypothetical protein
MSNQVLVAIGMPLLMLAIAGLVGLWALRSANSDAALAKRVFSPRKAVPIPTVEETAASEERIRAQRGAV